MKNIFDIISKPITSTVGAAKPSLIPRAPEKITTPATILPKPKAALPMATPTVPAAKPSVINILAKPIKEVVPAIPASTGILPAAKPALPTVKKETAVVTTPKPSVFEILSKPIKDLVKGEGDYAPDTAAGISRNTALGLPKAAKDTAIDIGQGIARTVATVGVTAGNAPTQVVNRFLKPEYKQPLPFADSTPTTDNPVTSAVFGGKPIKTVQKATADVQEAIKPYVGDSVSKFAAGPIVGLGVALDLSGWGGKSVVKSVASGGIPEAFLKFVAKEVNPKVIESTLINIGVDGSNAKVLADQLSKADTVEKVRDTFTSFFSMKGATDEAAKTTINPLRDVETKATDYITSNKEALAKQYEETHGNIYSVDAYKELVPGHSANRTVSEAYHKPAADAVDEMIVKKLNEPGGGDVYMTAGATGSGKSTAIESYLKGREDIKSKAIIDGTLANLENSVKNIERALNTGHSVNIVYIETNPTKLADNLIARAASGGRTVPIETAYNTLISSRQNIARIAGRYGDNPNLKISVLDNTGNTLKSVENGVDFLKGRSYSEEDTASFKEAAYKKIDDLYANKQISKSIYEGFTRRRGEKASATETRIKQGLPVRNYSGEEYARGTRQQEVYSVGGKEVKYGVTSSDFLKSKGVKLPAFLSKADLDKYLKIRKAELKNKIPSNTPIVKAFNPKKPLESLRGGYVATKEDLRSYGMSPLGATHGPADLYYIGNKPALAMSWSEGSLAGISVHPDFQNKGIAKAMIRELAKDGPLSVYDPNEKMINLLNSLGDVSKPDGRGVVTLTLKNAESTVLGEKNTGLGLFDAPEPKSVSSPQGPKTPEPEAQLNKKSLSLPVQYDETTEKAISKMSKDVKESAGPVKRVVSAMRKYTTDVMEYLQDTDIRIKELQSKKGMSIDDASDPYLKMTLYPGRVGAKIDESRKVAEDIFADMKKVADEAKKDLGDVRKEVSEYLIARHAPERNAAIGEGAAGISTADAKARVKEIENSPQGAKIKEIADKAQAFNNRTLDILKESGVISDELYDTLRTKYKNHVPLQRVMDESADMGSIISGKGFDIKSTGIRRAKGSEREVADVLGNIITNYEQAVIRAEKNIVDQATLAFVRKNKNELGGLMKETQLPVMPVAKVTHKGQIFPEVMEKVEELINKYGGTHTRKLKTGQAFGSYRPNTKEVTTRFGTSKDTLIHEFGHLLDFHFGLRDNGFFDTAVSTELRKVADLRNASMAYGRKAEEKIAEFVSMYFADRANAKAVAPITTRKFENFMADKPELRELSEVMKSRERAEETIEEIIFARQQFTNDPSILTLKQNGKNVYIKIDDPHLAVAFKGIGREKLGSILNAVASFTRLYSGLATRFNPEFAFPNKLRDLQETAVFLASQKGMGFKGAAGAVTKDPQSIKDVIAGVRGKDTPGAKLYLEMQQEGGTTGGMGLSTRKQVGLDLDKMEKLANSKTRRVADNLIEYVDIWNTIFEDSTRLSVYKQALAQGLSKQRAAALAKEASINFNRMGKGGPVINALWMFANASIQGTTKMIRSLKNPKVLGATVLAVGGAVATVSEWNDSVDPDWRDKVTKYDRLNGLTVVIPSEGSDFHYFTVPVSWGLKPIKVMADYAYDSVSGKQDFSAKEFAGDTAASMIEAYNPVGGTDLVSALVPSILDVPVELNRNRSWSGVKIKPDFDQNAPADIRYFDSLGDTKTGRAAISISELLKDKANFAVSPADIKYAFDQYVGGAGRTVSKTANLIGGIASKEDVPLDEYPFLSRFYRERSAEEIGNASGGRPEELKGILAEQSRERFKIKKDAQAIDKELQALTPAEANARVAKIKKEDPELFAKIKAIASDRKKGLTGTDKLMLQLGVENGERAKYIDAEIMKLPSSAARNAYYKELREKKIISDEVAAQIKKLRSKK